MSTAEIVAVAGSAIVVVILIVAVVVRGRRRAVREPEEDVAPNEGSMFDRPPSDTLAKLGRPEERGETPDLAVASETDQAPDVEWERAPAPAEEPAVEERAPVEEPASLEEPEPTSLEEPKKSEPEGEVVEAVPPEAEAAAVAAREAEAAAVEEEAPPEPPSQGNLVPLSSIIVTTSNKIVDLEDPEIRRMLTDLVTFEIDQAAQFREQGQTIDAVLQLTEAEKICRALGKEDTAGEIRVMMRELQG